MANDAPTLSFRGVSVSYNGAATPAVDHLDVDIHAGELVALVGPSGAGKSTFVALANGLVLPTEGTVEVFGVDTRVLGQRRHRPTRRRIGTVHQSFALVGPLRVAHNVAAGRLGEWGRLQALRSLVRVRDVDAIAATLDRVGIGDKLWDRADQLSGGQQQRVAIARALFQHPELLLADEPLSSLDPTRSKSILQVLVDACSDGDERTLVASLHDAPLATSHAERIIGLREGRVAFDLPATDVTESLLEDLYVIEADGESPDAAQPAPAEAPSTS